MPSLVGVVTVIVCECPDVVRSVDVEPQLNTLKSLHEYAPCGTAAARNAVRDLIGAAAGAGRMIVSLEHLRLRAANAAARLPAQEITAGNAAGIEIRQRA